MNGALPPTALLLGLLENRLCHWFTVAQHARRCRQMLFLGTPVEEWAGTFAGCELQPGPSRPRSFLKDLLVLENHFCPGQLSHVLRSRE